MKVTEAKYLLSGSGISRLQHTTISIRLYLVNSKVSLNYYFRCRKWKVFIFKTQLAVKNVVKKLEKFHNLWICYSCIIIAEVWVCGSGISKLQTFHFVSCTLCTLIRTSYPFSINRRKLAYRVKIFWKNWKHIIHAKTHC